MTSSSPMILAAMAWRTWLKTARRPVILLFSFVQPIIWMLFFGFLFQRYPVELDGAGISYLSFLVPGVATMTVLFGASQSGISLIRDMQTQFLPRMLGTPADRRLLLGGKIAADVVRLLVQAAIVCGLGVALGGRLDPGAGAMLLAALALFLFAAGYCALSCSIALKTRSSESMAAFVHLANMLVLFTSSALVPGRHMPAWLHEIAAWNPLSLAVEALRGALLLGEMPSIATCVLPLLVLATLLFLLASAVADGWEVE